MWLKACLNGSRQPGAHQALPITAAQLAEDGRRALDAGAVALHIHPRDAAGRESLAPDVIAEALDAVRGSCPGTPLEVSTAAWIEPDVAARFARVGEWAVLPDSAGVNFGEAGAADLAKRLLARGIGVEAGLFTAEDARRLVATGLANDCAHVQIEPILAASAAEALAIAQAIERVLAAARVTAPRLLHGKDVSAWPMLEYAVSQGYATRIGLEDTLTLADGRTARDNAELVSAARQVQCPPVA